MDTSKRIGPTLLIGSAATLYTVPASTKFLMRSMHIANVTGSDRTFTLSIGTDATGTRLYGSQKIYANSVIDWSGFMPLDAAEIIQGLADATNAVVVTIGGVEVT